MDPETPTDRRAGARPASDPLAGFPHAEPGGELAFRDPLTGLLNRRALNLLFAERWRPLLAAHGEITLLLFDLDLFKQINDAYGHLAGDQVLRRVAELMRETFRAEDLLVRFGGDEFVAVLPGAGAEAAPPLVARLREALAAESLPEPLRARARQLPLGSSVGIASAPADGLGGEEVLAIADRRLYAEKRQRRRPRRRRAWLLAVLLATVGAAAWVTAQREVRPLAIPVAPAPVATLEPARAAEIAALQAQVARLTEELAAARLAHPANQEPSAREGELERTIAALQEELERLSEPPAPAPVPPPSPPVRATPAAAPPPAPAPVPVVRPAPAPRAEAPRVTAPVLLSVPRPEYPPLARRLRRSANVELLVEIDADGRVTAVRQEGPPVGLGFDERARQAALRARYQPATRDGEPVPGMARLTVSFHLGEGEGP
ncbi:MAG TPA: TonB family protein [Thermoanaerobaculia bacterium]|nr:TonB family protein [Thermoanaerobaculia bacterium]